MYFCFDWCELCDQKFCISVLTGVNCVIRRFVHISISVLTGVNCFDSKGLHTSVFLF